MVCFGCVLLRHAISYGLPPRKTPWPRNKMCVHWPGRSCLISSCCKLFYHFFTLKREIIVLLQYTSGAKLLLASSINGVRMVFSYQPQFLYCIAPVLLYGKNLLDHSLCLSLNEIYDPGCRYLFFRIFVVVVVVAAIRSSSLLVF